MNPIDTIGLMELTSIGIGYRVQDVMLKAANVQLLLARTICSGKYLIAVAGDTAAVTASVDAGFDESTGALIEQRVISGVHPSIFPAISSAVDLRPEELEALGIIETFSASSIIDAADAAVKSAKINLFRVHLAMAVGGKGFLLLTGDVASVEAAVAAGSKAASDEGMLVSRIVIPAPRRELFGEFI